MIVAIDPGIDGAAAALSGCDFIDVIDLPTAIVRKRREIEPCKFMTWLSMMQPTRIIMENVHSMPKQGVAGVFNFGVTVGILKAACRMRLRNIEVVEPAVWKAYFDLIGGNKEDSRIRAIRLFAKDADFLERKKHHNRAEAMLIAWWAARPPIGRNWS